MANFLVTDDLGFVGSHFTEELYYAGHDVTFLDHLINDYQSYLAHLKNKFTVYISNVEQIKSTIFKKFDGIFYSATSPQSSSLIDPFQDIETICKGMISVLKLAKKDDAKVVFTSNSGIYGYSLEYAIIDMIDCTRKIQGKSNFLH
jgi:UDP-glucuronate decarboxylase